MEKQIIAEICRSLKWYEKVIVKIFKKTFTKLYHKIRINIFNKIMFD